MLDLEITVSDALLQDPVNGKIIRIKGGQLRIMHSLVSVSKWEAKHKKAFLKEGYQMTLDESIDYVRCMTVTQHVKPEVYEALRYDRRTMAQIDEYIHDQKTATHFPYLDSQQSQGGPRDVPTSELIYYMMIKLGIPIEFEKWHLSRLLTQIKLCSIKESASNSKSRKSSKDIAAQHRAIRARNRSRRH